MTARQGPIPHEGYVPGQPCNPRCPLCAVPPPEVGPANPLEGEMKRQLYESGRRLHMEEFRRSRVEPDAELAFGLEPT